MRIRQASGGEMLKLWGYPTPGEAPPTARYFYHKLSAEDAVFWAIDRDCELIGELYAFLNIEEDRDFADGRTRAYLCAFRVKKEYRGRGLGSDLMEAALAELKAMGFESASIGVDDERNERLYRCLGFDTKIKDCFFDPCARDENMRPEPVEEGFRLLHKEL